MLPAPAPASRRPSVVAGPSSQPAYPPPHSASLRPPPQPRPRGNSRSRPAPPPHTQPTTVRLTTSALRSLPHRLTHPPPLPAPLTTSGNNSPRAKGKERARWLSGWTLKIQPEYDVNLADVLDRKHLPPLGLKDLEEWLLFVEGTPENLYFILWLREYTNRYAAWTASLRSRQTHSLRVSSSQPSPLATSTTPPNRSHMIVPSERGRTYASIGAAMSTLSLPPPSPQSIQGANLNFSSSSPHTTLRFSQNVPPEDEGRQSATYKTHYAPARPPPNPELAMFYLRAKETFLTPNADYELCVGSEVLNSFHVGSNAGGTSDKKARRDSGVAFYEKDRDNAGPAGVGSSENMSNRPGSAMAGQNLHPPDPAVFNELAAIVEGELKESLRRMVVATYNNVGMPRAYCGSAGGCVIALLTSSPPIIATFCTGASRWFRLFAFPGLWLGMTIFISAMYGVCMMIYVFGDLRQLRSFELARPPRALAEAEGKGLGKDAQLVFAPPRRRSDEKERKGSLFSLKNLTASKSNKSDDKLSPTMFTEGSMPFRKESLVPVVTPVPMLPPPVRTRRARTSGSGNGSMRSRSKSNTPPRSPVEVPMWGGVEKPTLRVDIWGAVGGEQRSPGTEEGVAPDARSSNELQVPPRAVVRPSRIDEVPPHVIPTLQHLEDEDGTDDDGESEFEDEDEDDDELSDGEADDERGSPYRGSQSSRSRRRRRPPPIEISEAYYDENPSPEGPATAPADWLPQNLERLAALHPIPEPTARSDNPLWPDYASAQEAAAENLRRRSETALFIGPFVYDGSESGSSCLHHQSGSGAPGERSTAGKERDVEKGLAAVSEVQAAQPMNEFDFDGLPVRRPKPKLRVKDEEKERRAAERMRERRRGEKEKKPRRRSVSPGSTVSASTNGKPERWYWALVEWLQVKCGPANVVDVIEKEMEEKEKVREGEDGKGKSKAAAVEEEQEVVTPAQEVMRRAAERDLERGSQTRLPPPSPIANSLAPTTPVTEDRRQSQRDTRPKESWRKRLSKMYLSVPAFTSPLTPVLNPLVGRAQWEIVVRSAAVSAVVSVVVVAGIVGAPQTGR